MSLPDTWACAKRYARPNEHYLPMGRCQRTPAEFGIAAKDGADDFRLVVDDDEPAVLRLITERRHPAHPHPRILAVGIAQSYCWESPKPEEFGNAGQNRENIGWQVQVNFTELANRVR